ncbi:MAG TPA: SDR family NAD(P)-dependent oxidoreductase, partial [Anaerolineales bacterium]
MTEPTLIITGASRGLGAATAKIAAQLGANVIINARSEEDLAAMAQEIQDSGGRALGVAGDVSRIEDCWRLVNKALRQYGQVDAIINNAGIIDPMATIAESDPHTWKENIAINLLGPVYLTQAALPHLRKQNGRVINVSSGAAVKVVEGWSAYCSAKAALNHFNRILASEEDAITAIAFRPGAIDT